MNTSHSNPRSVAILGLGLMGAGMARRLVAAGFQVAVYNRNPARSAPFEGTARIARSPREAAEDADFIISMVADDAAAAAMWCGEQGAFATAPRGAICIESSTVSPDWIARWARQGTEARCRCLDAPVTGSRVQAESGELTFMVGGPAEVLAEARVVLGAMGKSAVPLGPVGSGAMFKLINNYLCGVQLASMAEAMVMIDRSGLDRNAALAALLAGAPASPLVKTVAGRMAGRDFTPNFLVRLMAKDLAYAAAAADTMGLDLAMARSARARLDAATEAGFGEQDISALYRHVGGEAAE
jgi:3-hydroxyisobutyrate dehydrogenase